MDGDPYDDNWHGTHNHGLIGATVNNTKGLAGIAGITRNIRQMTCKFLNQDGSGTLAGALECIEYVVKHGATIILLAWGSGHAGLISHSVMQNVYVALMRAQIMIIGAAGNVGLNIDSEGTGWVPCGSPAGAYPIDHPNLICVGSVYDSAYPPHVQMSPWSNRGEKTVHVVMRGEMLKSTSVYGDWGRATYYNQLGIHDVPEHTYWEYVGGKSFSENSCVLADGRTVCSMRSSTMRSCGREDCVQAAIRLRFFCILPYYYGLRICSKRNGPTDAPSCLDFKNMRSQKYIVL